MKKHPEFKDYGDNYSHDKVHELTDSLLLKNCFSELLEHPFLQAAESAHQEGLQMRMVVMSPEEQHNATERTVGRMNSMCNISIKLQLSKLNVASALAQRTVSAFATILDSKYGPTHAALLIGNGEIGYTVLEWNSTGLVVPHKSENDKRIFQMELQCMQDVCQGQVKQAANCLDLVEQVDVMFDASKQIARKIDNLIEVIIRYNRFLYYHPFVRNCHHFVQDALAALETPPLESNLTGNKNILMTSQRVLISLHISPHMLILMHM